MWLYFPINIEWIESQTEKALLIKIPQNMPYSGYRFWHPKKLYYPKDCFHPYLRMNTEHTYNLRHYTYSNGEYIIKDEIKVKGDKLKVIGTNVEVDPTRRLVSRKKAHNDEGSV